MMGDVLLWGPVLGSASACIVGVGCAIARVWYVRRPLRGSDSRAVTAQRFAVAFSALAALWLLYSLWAGYAGFATAPDLRWYMALHGASLWSVPLFVTAIAWAAGAGVAWVFRALQSAPQPRK